MADVKNLIERGMSRAQLMDVYARYIDGEQAIALIAELGLDDVTRSSFTQIFHRLPSEKECPYCKVVMLEDLPSKTYKRDGVKVYCDRCQHEDHPHCCCAGCGAAKDKRLVARFYETLSWQGGRPAVLSQLPLADTLAIYALMAHRDDSEMIAPLYRAASDKPYPLLPTQRDSLGVLERLLSIQALFPVPARNVRTAIQPDGQDLTVYYGYFHWVPNVVMWPEEDSCASFDDLRDRMAPWFYRLKTEATAVQMRELLLLLKDIAVSEAWRVISQLSDSLRFDADQRGGKLEQLIEQNAFKFTPGRFHYFCSKSVRDGYLAYKENRATNRRHAINMVPWRMERLLARCAEEQWDIRPTSEPRLQCRLEMLAQEILAGNLGLTYSLETHSPLEIEAAMREAGYFAVSPESA